MIAAPVVTVAKPLGDLLTSGLHMCIKRHIEEMFLIFIRLREKKKPYTSLVVKVAAGGGNRDEAGWG